MTIIMWFRNDLRIHDNPALATAVQEGDTVIPVFIWNNALLHGNHHASNRNRFLLECLVDLSASMKKLGGELVLRNGAPETVLLELAQSFHADAVYLAADYSPLAIKRDKTVKIALEKASIRFRSFGGRLAVSKLDELHTQAGTPHKVFTPFWRQWQQIGRRELAAVPRHIALPAEINLGGLPALASITIEAELSPDVIPGGETAARARLQHWLSTGVAHYKDTNNKIGIEGTSRLSAYLHFGCLSVREIETMLPDNLGAAAWHRQLAWREFYHYVIYKFPDNSHQPFQARYHDLKWDTNQSLLTAWQTGMTGYPILDAAMRQLTREGWMHNRARLIVGSFLTKDLWLNWQDGETFFMRWLLDGDEANNNGNWQWIASVGVDPAPAFRRLYNPSTQAKNFDPDGSYIRRYVPELKQVPDAYLIEPWTMPAAVQTKSHCLIGKDYPAPVIDHKVARQAALERFRMTKN
jgi:deoxyribodipyrimidine photo-lyase